jgi:hypothetical protein
VKERRVDDRESGTCAVGAGAALGRTVDPVARDQGRQHNGLETNPTNKAGTRQPAPIAREAPIMNISPDTVGWIIVKARELNVKVEDDNEGDEQEDAMSVLRSGGDDPTEAELRSWIEDLTDTEQAELVAMFWMGRGDGDASEFDELVETARGSRSGKTSKYLLGEPLLADYLEEALEALGFDTSEIESNLR